MRFYKYNFDQSYYDNVKREIKGQSVGAQKSTAMLKRYWPRAMEEYPADTLGGMKSGYSVISGEEYYNKVNGNVQKPLNDAITELDQYDGYYFGEPPTVSEANNVPELAFLPSLNIKDFLLEIQATYDKMNTVFDTDGYPMALDKIEDYYRNLYTWVNSGDEVKMTLTPTEQTMLSDYYNGDTITPDSKTIYVHYFQKLRLNISVDNKKLMTTSDRPKNNMLAYSDTFRINNRKLYSLTDSEELDIEVHRNGNILGSIYNEIRARPEEKDLLSGEENAYAWILSRALHSIDPDWYWNIEAVGTRDKNVILKALTAFKEELDELIRLRDTQLAKAVKEKATAKLLKHVDYLTNLADANNIEKLDFMYMSWRIDLRDNVNRFNDKDSAFNRTRFIYLMADVPDWYKYVNVIVDTKDEGYWVPGSDTDMAVPDTWVPVIKQYVVAYVPSVERIFKANTIKSAALLNAMFKIENHTHVKKRSSSFFQKLVLATIIIVITVASGGTAGPMTATMLLSYTAAALSAAAILTGDERLAEAAKIAGYAALATGALNALGPNATEASKQALRGQMVQYTIKLAQMGMNMRYNDNMDKIKDKSRALTKKINEIEELEMQMELEQKVRQFIYEDSYSIKYEFDRMFNKYDYKVM